MLRYRAARYDIECDGHSWSVDAMLIAAANGRQYGNRVIIAPNARLDDARLELVIVEPQSLWGIARRLPSLFRGRLQAGGGVTMREARVVRIRTDGVIPYHVDGELGEAQREVVIAVDPAVLRVRV